MRLRFGVSHFREIGKRGFQSLTDRYFLGEPEQAGDWLRRQAHEKRIDGYADRKLSGRLENREKTVGKVPVLSDPDDGGLF
jgi:hypothetical protein